MQVDWALLEWAARIRLAPSYHVTINVWSWHVSRATLQTRTRRLRTDMCMKITAKLLGPTPHASRCFDTSTAGRFCTVSYWRNSQGSSTGSVFQHASFGCALGGFLSARIQPRNVTPRMFLAYRATDPSRLTHIHGACQHLSEQQIQRTSCNRPHFHEVGYQLYCQSKLMMSFTIFIPHSA